MTQPASSADRGLQAERTALAWGRTGLAVFVNSLVEFRAGWISDSVATTAAACILSFAAAAIALYGIHRRRLYAAAAGTPKGAPAFALYCIAFVALLACATALTAIAGLHWH